MTLEDMVKSDGVTCVDCLRTSGATIYFLWLTLEDLRLYSDHGFRHLSVMSNNVVECRRNIQSIVFPLFILFPQLFNKYPSCSLVYYSVNFSSLIS